MNAIPPHSTIRDGSMRPRRFWRRMMEIIFVGKGAVAGAGLTLALLGFLNVLANLMAATTTRGWLLVFQEAHLDGLALTGGVIGIIVAILTLVVR